MLVAARSRVLFKTPIMRVPCALMGAATRRMTRALVVAAAGTTPPGPLGQDLGELFALYAPPPYTAGPLPVEMPPRPLGMLKPRGEVHRDGDWHRSVHIWLVDAEGRMLLQKRSEHKDTNPGMLDVSCAGHVTGDDPLLETAMRELEEELGLSIAADELEDAWVCTLPSSHTGETKFGKYTCNEYQEIYVVDGWGFDGIESLKLGADEVAGIELMDAGKVIAAWEEGDERFVPRGAPYRRVIGCALGYFPGGYF